jgi:hypothetical protein
MKKIIALTMMGDCVYFMDDNFTDEQKNKIQNVADGFKKSKLWSRALFADFRAEVKNKLKIELERVEISVVIRVQ